MKYLVFALCICSSAHADGLHQAAPTLIDYTYKPIIQWIKPIPKIEQLGNPNDRWGSPDKLIHFGYSMAAAAIISHHARGSNCRGPLVGITTTIELGFFKEVYDSTQSWNYFSWKDFIYDIAGAVVGGALIGC